MTDSALLEEFNAEAEAEKNETRGAVGDSGHFKAETKLGVIPKDQRATYRKVAALCKRAIKISDEGDHVGAAKHALKALDAGPDTALANHTVGLLLFRLGRLSRALEFYERAWKLDPADDEIYLNMGIVAWKLDMLEAAEKFYRLCVQVNPDSMSGMINLASVLRDQAKFEDAIELLRERIYLHPENAELWNSLGTVLSDSGDPVGAVPFYTEALRLKPNFARAHNNLANVYELIGEPENAVTHFEEALKNPQDKIDRATMLHGHSLALLASGRLAEGWKAQRIRLDPDNTQATLFVMNCPMWEGDDLDEIRGKSLVWIGEQGLGDEVLFLNQANDLIDSVGPDGELRIAVEYRLVDLVARSFPKAKVYSHRSAHVEGRDVRVLPKIDKASDYWTPMATPLRSLRNSVDSFPKDAGFLTPDPDRQEEFRQQLAAFGPGLKVGILWKSLKMNARRARFFSAFDAWKPVLDVEGVEFVNLQYGKVEDELEIARERFGVTVHQPEGIDLKMDLDGVAALSSACDLVMGPMNATTNLAAASGANVWFIHARSSTWTMLGAGRSLWYPQTRSFFGEGFQDWENTMGRVATELAAHVKATG